MMTDTIKRHAAALGELPKDTLHIVLDALRVRAMDFVEDALGGDGQAGTQDPDVAADIYRDMVACKGDVFDPRVYGQRHVVLKAWVGRPDLKARALEESQQSAARLLSEIESDGEVMRAIRKASDETAADIVATVEKWNQAGETFLRSVGQAPPVSFPKGSILVVSWEDAKTRRGVVRESKPDEVTLDFEGDEDEDGWTFERVEGGWVEINESSVLVQIDYERDETATGDDA